MEILFRVKQERVLHFIIRVGILVNILIWESVAIRAANHVWWLTSEIARLASSGYFVGDFIGEVVRIQGDLILAQVITIVSIIVLIMDLTLGYFKK